ncbi:MAG: LTA synthase family protein [Thermoanaerobaculia bacterium]|nr:LTA synthase family protein [Thermoanaerobaculia bacterium]
MPLTVASAPRLAEAPVVHLVVICWLHDPPIMGHSASPPTAPRLRLVLVIFAFAVLVSTATRAVLFWTSVAGSAVGAGDGLGAFAIGFLFDVVVALGLTLPWSLYFAVVPRRWLATAWHRGLLASGLFLFSFGVLFVAVAEYFFFDEFASRFNFVAVDYLLYPTEVSENIWQSYPTGWILSSLGLAAAGLVVGVWSRLGAGLGGSDRLRRRLATAGLHGLCLGIAVAVVSSDWTQISPNRAVDELAGNGYWPFVDALTGRHAPYQGIYATLDPQEEATRVARLLAESPPAANPLALRPVTAVGPVRRANVVVVLEESFGAEFVGALHPRAESLTPQFDALAEQGTLLTQAYSTGNRTIRAIEATTTGLPPLPGSSLVRRAQSKDLFTLPSLLRDQGYETLFLYGGRALFDGMAGYLSANGVDRIVDQGDFPPEAFRTAWGVADEALFDRALAEMDTLHARRQPFYSLLLTVSNHRPYRFPEENLQPLPGLKRRENAVRYADHALGRFLRAAREHPFYADTLFVLMGDHGARVYGAAEVPLASYEVPVLLIGPGIEAGRRVDTLASSLDIPPTVLGVLGLSYGSQFFGQDVLNAPPERGRAFFVHNHNIGMLRDDRIAVLGLHQTTRAFRIEGEDLRPLDPGDPGGSELIRDTIATFESVDRYYRADGYRRSEPADGVALAAR